MSDVHETAATRTALAAQHATRATLVKAATAVVLLAVGAAAGWWWGQRAADAPAADTTTQDGERKVLYWYDPMAPQHHFDRPGKSPFMDMDLVPRYADDGADESTGANATASGAPAPVRIEARVAQNLGLREARVERITLAAIVDASGLLGFNQREVAIEQVRTAGLVERVWPLASGDAIAAGQPLIELRAPQWSAAQAEYLAVQGDSALAAAARERLRMLGQSEAMIAELEQTGRARQTFILRSSRAGVLEALDVRSGMRVEPGQTLARIQGVDTLWLDVAVPESRATAVRLGAEARVQLAAYPGRDISGSVIAQLPELAPGSRTLQVRIELPNDSGALRAGMSARVQLAAPSDATALAVPTEAVIRTGSGARIIAVREDGGFQAVDVELGPEIGERTVILAGIDEGQRVVASAQFLLDSEASLSGAFQPTDDAAPNATESTAPSHRHDAGHTAGEQP